MIGPRRREGPFLPWGGLCSMGDLACWLVSTGFEPCLQNCEFQ